MSKLNDKFNDKLNSENYNLNSIIKIQKNIRNYLELINNLSMFKYNKKHINYYLINVFESNLINKRCNNDSNNKNRELIIGAIINNYVPDKYYKYSLRWKKLHELINNYILKLYLTKKKLKDLTKKDKIKSKIKNVVCVHKGNRRNHIDFEITINNKYTFITEFKFNVSSVEETPQFSSPMYPSQYFENSYEEYYYDNYLPLLIKNTDLKIPNKIKYLKEIHKTKPECLIEIQKKYYSGAKQSSKYTGLKDDIDFYNLSKNLSKESIIKFIEKNDLNVNTLTKYLLDTQINKNYMLFKNFYQDIILQQIDKDNYIIENVKKDKNRYVAMTKNGNELQILLRWKNGNGIAFPSFQIKLKTHK